ncbi:hypothetical protein EYF80_068051 [Liparis tanakae]|uniref:Uncharacterized protein n=1 Tax=Liparis tanakae TaxID=230148 RepID=A0A4Z2DZH0_9TELE|nr:hypothetical protein EYF80_068051 [Liparis tanakae]
MQEVGVRGRMQEAGARSQRAGSRGKESGGRKQGQGVVHDAFTRYAEDSLMQSVCEQPTESTEVTIKVSGDADTCVFNTRRPRLLSQTTNNQQPTTQRLVNKLSKQA